MHFATQTTDQFNRRFDSPTGCQQIVDHQYFIASFDRINVDLQLIGAVLQLVAFGDRFTRQLARFTHRDKTYAHGQRDRRAKQETTRFGAHDFGDAGVFVLLDQQFNAERVGFRVFQ